MSASVTLKAIIQADGTINLYGSNAYPGGQYILKAWVDPAIRGVISTPVADKDGKFEYLAYPGPDTTGVPYDALNFAVYDTSDHRISAIVKPEYGDIPSNGNSDVPGRACLITALGAPYLVLEFIRHFIRPILPPLMTTKYYSWSAKILA